VVMADWIMDAFFLFAGFALVASSSRGTPLLHNLRSGPDSALIPRRLLHSGVWALDMRSGPMAMPKGDSPQKVQDSTTTPGPTSSIPTAESRCGPVRLDVARAGCGGSCLRLVSSFFFLDQATASPTPRPALPHSTAGAAKHHRGRRTRAELLLDRHLMILLPSAPSSSSDIS